MSSFLIKKDAVKAADDDLQFEIDFYEACVNVWRANEDVDLGEKLRPTVPDGFAYNVAVAGNLGSEEPEFPAELGQTVASGSATLECVAAGSNGVSDLSSPSVVVVPSGELSVTGLAVSEGRKLVGTYTGGVVSSSYEVVFSFTLRGKSRVARQLVKVKKQ